MSQIKWKLYKKGLLPECAPHVYLGEVDFDALFNQYPKALYIRYTSNFDNEQSDKYYHVIKDGDFSLELLPSKTRNMVRKCLNNCRVQQSDAQSIISMGGYEVYKYEMSRYQSRNLLSKHVNIGFMTWSKRMIDSEKHGNQIWAVFHNEEVIAYAITRIKNGMADLVTWKCNYGKYKNFYPSYGLVYSMTEYFLKNPNIQYVDDGNKSFTQHSAVQDFLIDKFNYRKAYAKLNVKFRWWLKVGIQLIAPFENYISNNQLLSLIRMYKWSK